jgi:hypothetical protein
MSWKGDWLIMRKPTFILLGAACCGILAVALSATNPFLTSSALAGTHYSTQTIAGTYAWRCTGYAAPALGAAMVPAVAQGTVTSDVEGLFKGGGTLSLGGQIIQERIEGPALVNPDGTGSIVYKVSIVLPDGTEVAGPDWYINFLVLDHGNGIWGMPYNAGTAMSCTLQRMEKNEK